MQVMSAMQSLTLQAAESVLLQKKALLLFTRQQQGFFILRMQN